MVAQGRPYLAQAWWLALLPGLAIVLTTMSLNLLSGWMRTALDPSSAGASKPGGAPLADHVLDVIGLSVEFHTAMAACRR